MGILPKESRVVSEEEDDNDETTEEGDEEGDECVCMDGEDNPPDDLRYNGEYKKKRCINWEHAEDSFEANNHNISKVRSEIYNTIDQSKTQAKSIDLIITAHPQFLVLNSRHE